MNKKVAVIYRDLDETGPYRQAIARAGIEPVLIEAGAPVSLGDYAGLLLTGGSDINPALYGEAAGPETDPPDDERDAAEGRLIDECLERDVPLFAICRGLQILNVHLGGSLVQHLEPRERHQKSTPDRRLPAHSVRIAPDTLLASIAGQPDWSVNSRHHQAIARLGRGLRICARDSEDETVEAIEYPDRRFLLAVQWHPEDQAPADAQQLKLFRAFSNAL